MAALAIAGAAFVFIRAGFGDEQRTTVGPDPGSVCPSKSHLDPAYVDLNGTEVSSDVLAEPGVSRDQLTLVPAGVVDEFFTNPEARLSDAPTEGWRPILEDQEHGRVEIAAPMPDGKTWYYVNFVKDGGEWSLAGWGRTSRTRRPPSVVRGCTSSGAATCSTTPAPRASGSGS